jgi:PAS domain S-box-containing protein
MPAEDSLNVRPEHGIERRDQDALLRSERQSRAELADLTLIQKISEHLIEEGDVGALYEKILDAAVDITRTDRGTMQTLDAGTGELCLLTARGMPPQVRETFARVSLVARTSCAEALRRGERVLVDYATDARFAGTDDARAHLDAGIRSAQSTPLVARSGRLVGMLTTHWPETYVPSERDSRLLDILARQAADLIERKRAEDQLRRNHETFFDLIQNSPFGIYIVDAQFRLRQVSAGAQKVFQRVRPLIGRDFAEVLRAIWEEPFAGEAIARFRHTLETGEPYVAFDTIEQRLDIAAVESYDWRIERILLPDGQFGVVCHFYDLSDIRRAEAEIRRRVEEAEESRRILQGIMEYVPEGITVADGPDVTIRMVSRHGVELAGRPADRLVGEADAGHPETWNILHPDTDTYARPEELPLTRAVRQGEVVTNEEWRLRRPDGSDVTILCNAGPIRNGDGSIVGGVMAWRDIAELKRAERVLKEADRRKDAFLATLGHELRNPLGAIRMALHMLPGTNGDPERFEKLVAILDRQSLQLVRLIDDLLDVSRITHDRIGLRQQRLELAAFLTQALEGIRPLCESQHVNLTAVLPPLPVMVEADAARLGQVIGNLLHNASKFTPPGGRIRLVLEREGAEAVIRVQDTGKGIPPEQLPRLFEMFGQLDPLRDRARGGLGIGLMLSKRLVEMHGGTIEARSDGPGRGSEFIVRLPIAPREADETRQQADPEVARPVSLPQPRQAPRRRRILVVDDNADVLHTIAAYLRPGGHEVLEAADGEGALQAAEVHRPDVVLLDIGLPGMDGYEVARRIRQRPWGRDVTIVAMSGWGQEDDKRQAAEAGCDRHLTKPADVEEIERILFDPDLRLEQA